MEIDRSFLPNFRAHHVDLNTLEHEAIRYQNSLIEDAARSGRKLKSAKTVEDIKKKRVKEQVALGIAHNKMEDELAKIREEQEKLMDPIRDTEKLFKSEYTAAPRGAKKNLEEMQKRDTSLQRRAEKLHDALDKSNRGIRGSQHQEPIHFVGTEKIKRHPY